MNGNISTSLMKPLLGAIVMTALCACGTYTPSIQRSLATHRDLQLVSAKEIVSDDGSTTLWLELSSRHSLLSPMAEHVVIAREHMKGAAGATIVLLSVPMDVPGLQQRNPGNLAISIPLLPSDASVLLDGPVRARLWSRGN